MSWACLERFARGQSPPTKADRKIQAPCQIKGPDCTFPVGMNTLLEKICLFFAVVAIISLVVTACLISVSDRGLSILLGDGR